MAAIQRQHEVGLCHQRGSYKLRHVTRQERFQRWVTCISMGQQLIDQATAQLAGRLAFDSGDTCGVHANIVVEAEVLQLVAEELSSGW